MKQKKSNSIKFKHTICDTSYCTLIQFHGISGGFKPITEHKARL